VKAGTVGKRKTQTCSQV